jgi:hypothetical protein
MPEEDDWLLNPVLNGCCRYESLKDGTLDLSDIARMNDALSVRADNQRLAMEKEKSSFGK